MATVTRVRLSGGTDGLPICVSSTAGGATTVHTGVTSTSTLEEIYVYATNSSTNSVTMYLEWGASASQVITAEIPPRDGPVLVVPGFLLQGRSAAGTVIYAYASTSNTINLFGWVNRIT